MRTPKAKVVRRARRHRRVRKRVFGTPARARLCVFRSLRHIYAQVIDDTRGRTLAAISTQTPSIRDACRQVNKTAAAAIVGKEVAQRALAAGVARVAFDRGGFAYHGRVKALAEAARATGLKF